MDGGPGTADAELNDAESTNESISQWIVTMCENDNDKYQLECVKYKRLAAYQLQLFLTKGYRNFICCKFVEIPSYLHAVTLN